MSTGNPSESFTFGVAARAVAAGRPSHIVVFHEGSEKMVGTFQKNVKRHAGKTTALSEGVVNVSDTEEMGKGDAKAFLGLGIMAATLTPDEHQRLLKAKEVKAIVPNEQRFIAGRPSEPAGSSVGRSFAGGQPAGMFVSPRSGLARAVPSATSGEAISPLILAGAQPNLLLAYLAGQRDAIDNLMGRLSPPSHAPGARAIAGSSGLTWGLTAIGISSSAGQPTGSGVKVAILDTGLDLTHPDWIDRQVVTNASRRQSFVLGVDSIQDGNGHGTHTAGTLAGSIQSIGDVRYGVAPECDLFVGKVLDDSGSGFDSDILAGIQWAITNQCRIISMSLASVRDAGTPFAIQYEDIAARYFNKTDGVLFIAAASNESQRSRGIIAPIGNPAACPSFMAVAAVDQQLVVADFSCAAVDGIGLIDLAGPGVGVYSSVPVTKGSFAQFDGTSMATPHVAGIAACFLQSDSTLTPSALRALLNGRAHPLSDTPDNVGNGIVHLDRIRGG